LLYFVPQVGVTKKVVGVFVRFRAPLHPHNATEVGNICVCMALGRCWLRDAGHSCLTDGSGPV
jgi:hypothetical protein